MRCLARITRLCVVISLVYLVLALDVATAHQASLDEALLSECSHGSATKVRDLINQGANVNASNRNGDSPLHVASPSHFDSQKSSYLSIIKALVAAGAKVNAPSHLGKTPLHEAVSNRSADAIRVLLDAGANANVADNEGRTPLHLATELACAKVLIGAGAKLDVFDAQGITPVRMMGIARNQPVYECMLAANGGTEPMTSKFAPNPTLAATSTAELIANMPPIYSAQWTAFQKELISRGESSLPEIQSSIDQGAEIENFHNYFALMGPSAVKAIPTLVTRLTRTNQVAGAICYMDVIRPGTFAGLPEATKKVAAEKLGEAIAMADDIVAGGNICVLCGIGQPASSALLRLLKSPRSHIRYCLLEDLRFVKFFDQQLAKEMYKLAWHDPDLAVREAAIEAFGRFAQPDAAAKSGLLDFIKSGPLGYQGAEGQNWLDSTRQWYAVADKAAFALGSRFGSSAIDDLLPLLSSVDSPQRVPAITALGCMGSPAIPRLTELANDQNQAVATSAKVAIEQIISMHAALQR